MAPNVHSQARPLPRPWTPHTVLHTRFLWLLGTRLPVLFAGGALHRAALHATARGSYPTAEALYERAAERYRIDFEVEALARLRVHQLIARVRALGASPESFGLGLEVEQRLSRLSRIESLEPPFTEVPASRLLASWTPMRARGFDAGDSPLPLRDVA